MREALHLIAYTSRVSGSSKYLAGATIVLNCNGTSKRKWLEDFRMRKIVLSAPRVEMHSRDPSAPTRWLCFESTFDTFHPNISQKKWKHHQRMKHSVPHSYLATACSLHWYLWTWRPWNKSVVLSRQECREPEALSDGNLGWDSYSPHQRYNVTRYAAHAWSFRSKIPKGHLYNINVMR